MPNNWVEGIWVLVTAMRVCGQHSDYQVFGPLGLGSWDSGSTD